MSLLLVLRVTVAAAATPPANFSCAIGEVGLAFARQLQPERTNFSGFYEALVAPHCHSDSDPGQHDAAAAAGAGAAATAAGDLQPGHGLRGWRESVPQLPPLPPSNSPGGCPFYVDGSKGADAVGGGSSAAPFKTIGFAVGHVPAGQPCTILLHNGTHHVSAPITIGPDKQNLTVMPVRGATAVISGGMTCSWSSGRCQPCTCCRRCARLSARRPSARLLQSRRF